MKRFTTLIGKDRAEQIVSTVVDTFAEVYEGNASRHDELFGDDAITFGINCWRNGVAALERAFDSVEWATTASPNGSFVLGVDGVAIRFYKGGYDEVSGLAEFSFDGGSATKRRIPVHNQMRFDLEGEAGVDEAATLRELVVVHSGNPVDGLCAVWMGAAVLGESDGSHEWAWVEQVWVIDRPAVGEDAAMGGEVELPEILVEFVEQEDIGRAEELEIGFVNDDQDLPGTQDQ